MAEIFDIGKKLDERNAGRVHIDGVMVPGMLYGALDDVDPNRSESNEIIMAYQQDIVDGVVAKDALRQAILKARRLS